MRKFLIIALAFVILAGGITLAQRQQTSAHYSIFFNHYTANDTWTVLASYVPNDHVADNVYAKQNAPGRTCRYRLMLRIPDAPDYAFPSSFLVNPTNGYVWIGQMHYDERATRVDLEARCGGTWAGYVSGWTYDG